MKPIGYILGLCSVGYMLGGCAADPPPATVQEVVIKSETFCELVDKRQDLTWSVNDTRETITSIRRMGAKWDARCGKASKPTS